MHTPTFAIIAGLGTTEIILILLVVLVLFGARKIPQFAKGLGQGIKEFKDAANGAASENSSSSTSNTANTPARTTAQAPDSQA